LYIKYTVGKKVFLLKGTGSLSDYNHYWNDAFQGSEGLDNTGINVGRTISKCSWNTSLYKFQ